MCGILVIARGGQRVLPVDKDARKSRREIEERFNGWGSRHNWRGEPESPKL